MKYILPAFIAIGLAMPVGNAYCATNSGQSASTLSTTDSMLVAKKKKKAKKGKAKVAKR